MKENSTAKLKRYVIKLSVYQEPIPGLLPGLLSNRIGICSLVIATFLPQLYTLGETDYNDRSKVTSIGK